MSRRRDPVSNQTVGILERMIEMLRLESQGIPPTEMIALIVKDTECSESAAWRTWQDRGKWKPLLLGIDEELGIAYINVIADLTEVRRLALNAFHTIQSPNARVGALGKATDAADKLIKILQSTGEVRKVAEKHDVSVDTKEYTIILSDVGAKTWEEVKVEKLEQEEQQEDDDERDDQNPP